MEGEVEEEDVDPPAPGQMRDICLTYVVQMSDICSPCVMQMSVKCSTYVTQLST